MTIKIIDEMALTELKQMWRTLFPNYICTQEQFAFWGTLHTADVMKEAFVALAKKRFKCADAGEEMDLSGALAYCSSVMNRATRATASSAARSETKSFDGRAQ